MHYPSMFSYLNNSGTRFILDHPNNTETYDKCPLYLDQKGGSTLWCLGVVHATAESSNVTNASVIRTEETHYVGISKLFMKW